MSEVTFAEWLLDRRRAAGLTQDQLAEAVGRHRSYIVKLEKGRIKLPTEPVRSEFHRVLGTSEDDLVRLGIVSSPRAAVWLYQTEDPAPSPSASSARREVARIVMDPRIPDDAVEGIRRVLLGYLDRED